MRNALRRFSLRRLPVVTLFLLAAVVGRAEEPLNIGSRLEPLIDDHLVDQMTGSAALVLQKPEPREVVLVTDKPWEGNTCAYYTVFRDGPIYRMYYRGSHYDQKTKKAAHREVTCYAESRDGVQWTKPELGLFDFEGSKQNNIVWDGIGTHCFTPFKDTRPDCPPAQRYKAIGRGRPQAKAGLYAFQSPDGIRWSLMSDEPVITQGAFDSQNLAFWDAYHGVYREYHRAFRGVRDIMTGTSEDFLTWTKPRFLSYGDAPKEHLYTNAVQPYARAPHILLGFPTRFQPQRGQQVEPTFMTSRDGLTFRRWTEEVIPVTAPEDRDGNRSNYMTWGLVQRPEAPCELSVYATEAYYAGPDSRVRRFAYRLDGFVALHTDADGGSLLTKPLKFSGKQLVMNYRVAKGGNLRVEIQGADGEPLEGFRLADCKPLVGDTTEQVVYWEQGSNVASLAGKTVRLRFEMSDADVFSLRFAD